MPSPAGEPRPGRPAFGPEPATSPDALAEALERVRTCVHRWLDRIEAQAERGRDPEPDREQHPLARRIRELEQQRDSLQEALGRREQEWAAQLEALDHDRSLLAEAWERLEGEQIASSGAARPPERPVMASGRTAPRPAAPEDDVVDRMIVRQFEALRRDVRREAESRHL